MNLVNEKKLLEEAEKQNISLVTKSIHKWVFSWKKEGFLTSGPVLSKQRAINVFLRSNVQKILQNSKGKKKLFRKLLIIQRATLFNFLPKVCIINSHITKKGQR